MPVYEQSYSHYEGIYRPRSLAWTVIARRGIGSIWYSKGSRGLLIFCLAPFLLYAIRVYLAANLDLLRFMQFNLNQFEDVLEMNDRFYYTFLLIQAFPCFLMTLYAGSDLIASDRRSKALTLYLSKPLTRLDYLFGKGAVLLFYLYLVTLIPSLVLAFLYAFFTENWGYLAREYQQLLRVVLASHVIVLPLLFLMLAISSMSKSKVSSGVMLAILYLVPNVLVQILRELTIYPWFNEDIWSVFSIPTIWEQLVSVIFRQETRYDVHWMWYVLMLGAILLVSSLILHRQIRAVEVVK